MSRSLSVVCTAMQLVNCIEAVKYYHSGLNDLVILAGVDRVEQIDNLLEEYSPFFRFDKVFKFNPSAQKQMTVIKEFLFIRKISSATKYDIVLVSNYKQPKQKYLLKRICQRSEDVDIVLIDDGLAVCEIARRRNQECVSKRANVYYMSKIYRLIYKRFICDFVPERLEYFTVYHNLEIIKNDTIVQNEYAFIKNNNLGIPPDIEVSNSVVFLGQPLVGCYGMSRLDKKRYCKYIEDALSQCGMSDFLVYYFPHPVENTHLTLEEDIASMFRIQVSNVPFEIISLKLDYKIPIMGFYSSALVNVQKFNKNRKIYAIYFDEISDSNDSRFRKVVNESYDYMKSIGIKIINR